MSFDMEEDDDESATMAEPTEGVCQPAVLAAPFPSESHVLAGDKPVAKKARFGKNPTVRAVDRSDKG